MASRLCLLLAAFTPSSWGTVNLRTFNNTAFAGPGIPSSPSDLSALSLPPFSSLRVSGTLTPAQADLLLLWVAPLATPFTGWLLLWLDDHLLIDTAQRGPTAWSNFSFATGAAPPALRLDWLNNAPTPCTIALSWRGNFTVPGPVPAAALSPLVAPAEAATAALRERAAAPPWAWGTLAPGSLWTHVQMPTALSIAVTLVRPSTGKALGPVFVYPDGNPAITRVLGHGYDGSTFTEISVGSWEGTVCTTTLSTTLDAAGNLLLLAVANGTACGDDLALLVTFEYQWSRAGAVAAAAAAAGGTQEVVATAPGFDAVRIYASAATVPVAKPQWKSPYFALALENGGAVSVTTGAPVQPSSVAAAIAVSRAAHAAQRARFPGDLADAYDAQQTMIAANTFFTPYEGLVTPVARDWTRGRTGYVIFPWDTLFLAWMASLEPTSKDISYANLIAVVQGRTQRGFPGNYHAATHDLASRSEPQIGAQITLEIYKRYGEAWIVEKVFRTLLGWQEWVWTQRMGGGAAAGPLLGLGSDLVSGDDENSVPSLGAAALESGIDNGVAWMDLDPIADWEKTPFGGRIRLYDVAASALFVAECEALVELAAVVNRSDVVAMLRARGAAVAGAMNATMWNAEEGVYETTFYNLTWHKRRMPTAFYPMLSTALPNDRVLAMLPLLMSPLGFCVNDTFFGDGDADSSFLVTFYSEALQDNVLCVSDACIGDAVNGRYKFVRQEGLAQLYRAAPGDAAVPLNLWVQAGTGAHALTASAVPPAPGYALVRQEGACFSEAAPGRVPLTLWYSESRQRFQTCAGNPGCLKDVAGGFKLVDTLCFGFNATTPLQMPCKFGLPSAARSDAAYFANNYWRGRIWGPQVALVWLGLQRHDAVPAVRAARKVLVKQALALELQNWRLSRHVLENINSICGAGEDGGGWSAEPFYTWGALLGHVGLLEEGF